MIYEVQILARSCGKNNVHHMDQTDLRALTLEAERFTGVPLVGTRGRVRRAQPLPGRAGGAALAKSIASVKANTAPLGAPGPGAAAPGPVFGEATV